LIVRRDPRRQVMLRILLLFVALLVPEAAQARTNAIQPELVAEGPAVPGGEVELALRMRTRPGWHGYWSNPGDAGLPMTVDWRLPPGFSVGELRYPVPTRLRIGELMNFVFKGDYAVLVRLKVPPGTKEPVRLAARGRWLACTDVVCVPEQGDVSLELPVGTGTPNRAAFDAWRKALPRPLLTAARFQASADTVRVAIPLPRTTALDDPFVFPALDGPVAHGGTQRFRQAGDVLVADLPAGPRPPSGRFSGLLALGDGRGLTFTALPGDVPSGGRPVGGTGTQAILWALLGALAGGLLLNLMPCVFPILALKALHLARSGETESRARSEALAYTAGAVAGTGALGVLLLLLRAGGSAAGWAFQLQDPRTTLILLLLAAAITLNLLGAFQLPTMGSEKRPTGSFGTGALAAFVATPCAGPFLGAALGTALLLPPAAAVAVFAMLGLGLAIPFLAIGFVPVLRRRLPRPGPWMRKLQLILAVPMGLSALAALWILGRQAGEGGWLVGLLALAALTVVLLWAGRRQRLGRRVPLGALALLGAIAVAGMVLVPARGPASASVAGARPWSEAATATALQSGRPAFVYFTADWCLTCKVNEAGAIDRAEVRRAFRDARVEVLAGDWTNGDPAITRFLESRGRAGVPLYLWYVPGRPAEELPQILTPAMLISRARPPR
jgi:DsbC/DsbD-like thiol-disulfide interchange protein/cytochrome c biogenesis protein CcdA